MPRKYRFTQCEYVEKGRSCPRQRIKRQAVKSVVSFLSFVYSKEQLDSLHVTPSMPVYYEFTCAYRLNFFEADTKIFRHTYIPLLRCMNVLEAAASGSWLRSSSSSRDTLVGRRVESPAM